MAIHIIPVNKLSAKALRGVIEEFISRNGTELDCNVCHHQHAKSDNYCAQCHKFEYKIP